MNRRNALRGLAGAGAGAGLTTAIAVTSTEASTGAAKSSIQLHTDLNVKLEEEAKLLEDFDRKFLPRIRKAKGFIDARLLKFKNANIGDPPKGHNYRLVQTFESEALREAWVSHEDHKIAWHEALESHVKVPFTAYLYEVAAEPKRKR